MVHYYRRIIIGTLLGLLLLTPSTDVLADDPEVEITVSAYIVGTPTGLVLTYVSDYVVLIEWTKGEGAVNTMIRASYNRVPESRTDGYLVYSGNLTSCNDTAVNLDETATPVYYRAWSQDVEGRWEEQGVSDSLEGFGMTTVAIALIVLVFTILAFWKRDAVLYLIGVIGWLFMTFYLVNREYPEENEYLPYAIAGLCLSITLVMAVQAIRTYWSDRIQPLTSKDIQREHRKKVLQITQRRKRPWYEE